MSNCNTGCADRVCIQAKKVIDACLKQFTDSQVEVILTTVSPPAPTLPLTFVSGRSTAAHGIIEDLVVTRIPDRPRYGRVQGTVIIPLEIRYTDALGVEGSGEGEVDVPFDIIMRLPEASIIPYQIEAQISAVCPSGEFQTTTAIVVTQEEYIFIVDACISIIFKVVVETLLLIPSYGYPQIPPCQDYAADVCSGVFELPLFPTAT
ncbi:MAG TPA: hypothetical protein PK675_00490 [Clostridia bacterium]|nr:hypothetical protein [Clostridia bacterium]